MMIRLVVSILLFSLAGCSPTPQSTAYVAGESYDESYDELTEISIAGLKGLYIDGSHPITSTVYIKGYITANDAEGEFPDMLVIEDSSGAIPIAVELEDMRVGCKLGCELTLRCSDLWLGSAGGSVWLGVEPTGDDVVDALSDEDFELRASLSDEAYEVLPSVVTIPSLNETMIYRYVYLSDVSFVEVDGVDSMCERNEETGRLVATSHTLIDRDGNTIRLYVPSTASYGEEAIPSGWGVLCAIVEYYYGSYSLRIVNAMYSFE